MIILSSNLRKVYGFVGEHGLQLVFVVSSFRMFMHFDQPEGWAYEYPLERALRIRAKVVLLRTEFDLLFVLIVFYHLAKI